MQIYDWIVIGGGLSGSALGYELAKQGLSVLLLEQYAVPQNATRYSYGGIAYWSGTTELSRQICAESIEIYRHLSAELDADIQFRELEMLLTIDVDRNPAAIATFYQSFGIPPKLISPEDAGEIEPLLKRSAIAGALHGQHGHVDPELLVKAYQETMLRLGGTMQIAQVIDFVKTNHRITGVVTPKQTYAAANVVVSAGAMSRDLLRSLDIPIRQYFTQAELIETPPLDLHLNSIIMPAELKRFDMEVEASKVETDALWDEPGHEITPAILDAGVIQFCNGRLRIGQISRTLTQPNLSVDAIASETKLRQAIGSLIPDLKKVPGQWCHCLVAFTSDRLPLIGTFPELEGMHIFSGFSNPFAFLPSLAQRYANSIVGKPDKFIAQLTPHRFTTLHA
jgi:glycine/D-amino acid oxidase-like deaminating enzyme